LTTFIPKLSIKSKEIHTVPKWKSNLQNSLTKNSLISRTQHILNSIVGAESNMSKWRRIEDLIDHIDQFPEAKNFAVKDGAIRILLLIRQSNINEKKIQGKHLQTYYYICTKIIYKN
jgi:calcium-independent phospholipase A2-gamma